MKAVRNHTDNPWVILYIERWLKTPFQTKDGTLKARTSGCPQGGVISPVLANLFLHYAFDKWMDRTYPDHPFARYADDGVVHCRTREDAEELYTSLVQRMRECKLEIHPDKTRIVYCKDDDRRENWEETSFDFLGYTFRPRRSKNKYGKFFINFTPAVSRTASKHMRQIIHDWRMHLKPDKRLEDLSKMFNPVIRGWVEYYGHFYKSELNAVLRYMNEALVLWVRRKYKKLQYQRRATHWLGKVAKRDAKLFKHWQLGILPAAG
jgi:RNA-directed DNA polymerase